MITKQLRDYAVDVVFCVDLTAGSNEMLTEFQEHWETVIRGIWTTIENIKGPVKAIRVRAVTFQDFLADKEALFESRFYELPQQWEEFQALIQSFEAKGGGDTPENALEALACALKSDWTREGDFRRHVICVLTDAPALPLQARNDCPDYPADMPKDLNELEERYHQETEIWNLRTRRLILLTPDDHTWKPIIEQWDHCLHIPLAQRDMIAPYAEEIGVFVCANQYG